MSWVHKLYEYDYDSMTIKLRNKKCPRCGSIMGFHKKPRKRWHCGNCGYTEFLD